MEVECKKVDRMKIEIVLSVIAGFLSAISFSVSGACVEEDTFLGTLYAETDGIGAGSLLILAALCIFYYFYMSRETKVRHWSIHLLALLFAGFTVLGMSFAENGNWSFVIGTRVQTMVAILVFLGFALFFDVAIALIFGAVDRLLASDLPKQRVEERKPGKTGKLRSFLEHHFFLGSFLVILLCWLPWIIFYLPASLPYDGCKALLQGLGEIQLTNQHSWALALFMGVIMRLGQHVSDNFGLFLLMSVFVVFELLCYATACWLISRWKIPFWLKVTVMLFFGIHPVFGAYAQAIIKDSVFMSAFVLYMAIYIDLVLWGKNKTDTLKWKRRVRIESVCLLLAGYLVSFLRNNGVYLVFLSLLFLIVLLRKGIRRYAVMIFAGVMLLYGLHNSVLAQAAGVTSVSERAKLSITFQIAARYMRDCPEDITYEERVALSKAFYGLDTVYDLGELYDPDISDPVKRHFRTSATEEELDAYMDVIVTMFQRHPGVCIQAVIAQSYGYFYLFSNCDAVGTYPTYMTATTTEAFEGFNISYTFAYKYRQALSEYASLWKTIPGLAQLSNPAMPTWFLFLLAGYFIYRKKWTEILFLAAPALNIAICMVSPVNGSVRYAMPSMACVPLLICMAWTVLGGRRHTEEETEILQMEESGELSEAGQEGGD